MPTVNHGNISFLLIEPSEPGNIGASARAIKNMGFKRLKLLNPCSHLDKEAYALAHGATDVLEDALVFHDLDSALKDAAIITGTSRREGSGRGIIMPLKEAAKRIADFSINNKVTILFGREDNGLYNSEIERCGFLVNIPTSTMQPSLNLAQAVLLTAYELSSVDRSETDIPPLIDHIELSELYRRIRDTLTILDYGMRGSEDIRANIHRNLMHLIGRYGLTGWEVKMLTGICARIERLATARQRGG